MSKSLMTTCMEVAITDNWIVLVWLIMEDSSISPPNFPATCMEYADSNTAITKAIVKAITIALTAVELLRLVLNII